MLEMFSISSFLGIHKLGSGIVVSVLYHGVLFVVDFMQQIMFNYSIPWFVANTWMTAGHHVCKNLC